MRKYFITGGCGFIGTNFILDVMERYPDAHICNIDKMGYASKPIQVPNTFVGHYTHHQLDLTACGSIESLISILFGFKPNYIIHFAAESHVDNSILNPNLFVESNVVGTLNLLEAVRRTKDLPWDYTFLHVSTDEVYGALDIGDPAFTEETPYAPNSPYSASKAASDHLVRAYHMTYGLNTVITHCSNNYGPHQHTEKLIPKVITNALAGKPIPIYGQGKQIRDWIHVSDHVSALHHVLQYGAIGDVYNIGGESEVSNLEMVTLICTAMQISYPICPPYSHLITFTHDRLGHDFRYAIDNTKMNDIGWYPSIKLADGLRKTISYYAKHATT